MSASVRSMCGHKIVCSIGSVVCGEGLFNDGDVVAVVLMKCAFAVSLPSCFVQAAEELALPSVESRGLQGVSAIVQYRLRSPADQCVSLL